MAEHDALAPAQAVATPTRMGRVRFATDAEAEAGTTTTRVLSVKQVADRVAAALDGLAPPETHPSFVIGPVNTLQVPGIWLETTALGVPVMLHYDDHDGAAGSNADGLFYAGPTNGLTGAGLWLQTDGSGHPMNLYYDDGAH